MRRRRIIGGTAAAMLLAAAAPADLAVPPRPAPACEGAAAERSALQAERAAINSAVGDIALGRKPKRRASGGEVAAAAAGVAASVLLPFGIGALVGAAGQAAAKGGKKKAPPEPDVAAMIERLHAIDWRLGQLQACG